MEIPVVQYLWQSSVLALRRSLVSVGREKYPTDGAGAGFGGA
jgi:hypothetical protein